MFRSNHPIASLQLTKTIFDDIISEHANSNSIVLISPMGNAVILGDVDDVEIREIDNDTYDYKFKDARGSVRTIHFYMENSDYGIIFGEDGYLRSTTGVTPPVHSDSSEAKDWYRVEIGMYRPAQESV